MNFDLINIKEDEFSDFYSEKLKEIKKNKLNQMEPSKEEFDSILKIILEYTKSKKRKIYGGYAWNFLFKAKDKKYAIYDEFDSPDIDFYSYDPINDMINICNELDEKGFKNIEAKEAAHNQTYRIYVNYQLYCDLTYIPRNIYSKIRFIEIEGQQITHPWFVMIDFFRMLTDPMSSWWRFDKHFQRFLILQKLYPLPKIREPLEFDAYEDKNIEKCINNILDIISEKDTILVTGFYAYNYYVSLTKEQGKNKYVNIPYIEAYSVEYKEDGIELIEKIKSLNDKINHKEFFPFSGFYGYNCVFYYEDIPIFYLYSTDRCIPYKNVDLIEFNNEKNKIVPKIIKNKKIRIGSFDFNILQALIILVKVRVDDDKEWNDILYKLINGFVNLRNLYLSQNKLKPSDDSIVGSFVTKCMGKSVPLEKLRGELIKSRLKKKKPPIIKYQPNNKTKNPANYIFPNLSGNEVKNDKLLKLKNNSSDVENDDESDFENKINESNENNENNENNNNDDINDNDDDDDYEEI